MKAVDPVKKELVFGQVDSEKRNHTYKFPKFVADHTYTQEMVYDELLEKHVENFLNGYNVNFLTFGQTGSGKTHTLLGPPGSFTKYSGSGLDISTVQEDLEFYQDLSSTFSQKKEIPF